MGCQQNNKKYSASNIAVVRIEAHTLNQTRHNTAGLNNLALLLVFILLVAFFSDGNGLTEKEMKNSGGENELSTGDKWEWAESLCGINEERRLIWIENRIREIYHEGACSDIQLEEIRGKLLRLRRLVNRGLEANVGFEADLKEIVTDRPRPGHASRYSYVLGTYFCCLAEETARLYLGFKLNSVSSSLLEVVRGLKGESLMRSSVIDFLKYTIERPSTSRYYSRRFWRSHLHTKSCEKRVLKYLIVYLSSTAERVSMQSFTPVDENLSNSIAIINQAERAISDRETFANNDSFQSIFSLIEALGPILAREPEMPLSYEYYNKLFELDHKAQFVFGFEGACNLAREFLGTRLRFILQYGCQKKMNNILWQLHRSRSRASWLTTKIPASFPLPRRETHPYKDDPWALYEPSTLAAELEVLDFLCSPPGLSLYKTEANCALLSPLKLDEPKFLYEVYP